MPLSKNVISREQADSVAIPYKPSAISQETSAEVISFAENSREKSDFRVDKIVSQMTGLDDLEKQSRNREIESEALRLSKEVQEQAYEKAHALGMTHGKTEAFEEEKQHIAGEISNLQSVVQEIQNLKPSLLASNKSHIVSLCAYFAKRLMMRELATDEAYILSVIEKAIEMAHSEEEVTVKVSPQDYEFLHNRGKETWEQMRIHESTKVESSDDVSPGGVIVETNYGVVDATIEQRILKLDEFLEDEGR